MMPLKTVENFKKILFSLVLLLAFTFVSQISPAFADSQIKDQFLQNIRAAVENKDEHAFWNLFNLEGVVADMKAVIEKHVWKSLKSAELLDVSYEPLPEDFRAEYVVDGIRYHPNLKVLGWVKFKYKRTKQKTKQGDSTTSVLYGQKGNRLLFVGTVKEKLAGDFPPSKQIQVIIIGAGHPPVTFEGTMIYLQGEKPVRDKLKDLGSGNLTRIVRGEAITFLEVRRTSPQGTLKVIIMEDEDTIFETEFLDTDQPIVFRK